MQQRPRPRLADFAAPQFSRGRPAVIEALWLVVQWMFVASWLPGSAHRRLLLRLFGARIGKGVVIKQRVRVKFPWRLSVGDHTWIGEDVLDRQPRSCHHRRRLLPLARRLPVHRQPRLVTVLLRSHHEADRDRRGRMDRRAGRRRAWRRSRRGRSARPRQRGNAGSRAMAGPSWRAGATGRRAAAPARCTDCGDSCWNVTEVS